MGITPRQGIPSATLTGLLLISALATAGCEEGAPAFDLGDLEPVSHGIIGGTETQDWPAIGAYWHLDMGAMCTATLVAEDVLLLAEHCLVGPGNQVWYVGHDVSLMDETNTLDISECTVSPLGHDTAICLLAEPVEDITPLPVNLVPFDETWDEQWFHYVGFGVDTGYGGPGSGIKRETDIQMYSWDEWEYVHFTAGTNTCSGDSGGPSLVEVDGDHYVAGVNSSVYSKHGDPCSGYGVEMRVDAQLDFLDEYFDPEAYQPPEGDDDDAAGDDDDASPGDLPDGGSPFAYGADGGGVGSSLCATGGGGAFPWPLVFLVLLGWLHRSTGRNAGWTP